MSTKDTYENEPRTFRWDYEPDPIADLEAAFALYEGSNTPEYLKGVMRRYRSELLGEHALPVVSENN